MPLIEVGSPPCLDRETPLKPWFTLFALIAALDASANLRQRGLDCVTTVSGRPDPQRFHGGITIDLGGNAPVAIEIRPGFLSDLRLPAQEIIPSRLRLEGGKLIGERTSQQDGNRYDARVEVHASAVHIIHTMRGHRSSARSTRSCVLRTPLDVTALYHRIARRSGLSQEASRTGVRIDLVLPTAADYWDDAPARSSVAFPRRHRQAL